MTDLTLYLELKRTQIEDRAGNLSDQYTVTPGRCMASPFQPNVGCRVIELHLSVEDDVFSFPIFIAKEQHPEDVVKAAVKDLTKTADDLSHVGHPS